MSKLTVIARIEAKKDSVELVKSELLKLIDITRGEKGCIQYDLHQDNTDPCVYFFYETWESQELLQLHINNDHMAEYSKAVDGHVKSFILNELSVIA